MTKKIPSFVRITTLLSLICLAVILASCGTMSGQSQSKPKSLMDFDAQAKQILAQMTLDEKIGQMIQSEYVGMRDKNDIQKYFLGSVLMGGDSDPAAGNGLAAWTDVYDEVQSIAMKTRLGIPVMYGVDAVHGHSNVIGAVIFPHNVGLGCTNDPEIVQEAGRITAIEMQATGMNWTFAPCVTVVRDERWGRTYEGFSEDPKISSLLGAAAVRGLQGNNLSNPLSVAACAKHYIADGGTSAVVSQGRGGAGFGGFNFGGTAMTNSGGVRVTLNAGNCEFDEETLRKIHLPPYKACVDAGVVTIMPSYSSWNGTKCSASKFLLTDLLKGELGFQGLLISDYNAIDQITRNFKEAIAISINAGMDMAMEPTRYAEFFTTLKQLVEEGTVPMSRIDDAVTRILRVKIAMGLLDKNRSHLADRKLHDQFGSKEHREVARKAVKESLVLLQNNNKVLPVAKTAKKILVAGINGDNIGNQCGGWTIKWQGQSGNEVTTGGTTMLQAIKNTVSSDTEVTYSRDGSGAAGSDVAFVFVGEERPYAEGSGDNGDLALSAQQVEMINTIKSAGVPVVAVIISGRPMIIGDILDKADAIIAAWLPGTEGQGVADVLFGDYKPTGKLSFTWPKSMDQLPINVGDSNYEPLYKYGFGLSY